jgi:hypothetical protein
MGEWLLSWRDGTIVARHEVPVIMRKIARSSGTIERPTQGFPVPPSRNVQGLARLR